MKAIRGFYAFFRGLKLLSRVDSLSLITAMSVCNQWWMVVSSRFVRCRIRQLIKSMVIEALFSLLINTMN